MLYTVLLSSWPYVALLVSNRPLSWMWNIRSPPFRYSMTKKRCSCVKTDGEESVRQRLRVCSTQQLLWLPACTYLRLECGIEVCEERILPGKGQHSFLHHGTLHIIVHQDHILLQNLDGKELSLPLQLSQQHLKSQQDIHLQLMKMAASTAHLNSALNTRSCANVRNLSHFLLNLQQCCLNGAEYYKSESKSPNR